MVCKMMCSKAQHDSPIVVLSAPSCKYDQIITQLPVRNMMPTPNFMEM